MWVLYALFSALFAGATSILAKCGIKKTDSTVATAIRTVVVLTFAWLMALLSGSAYRIGAVSAKAWVFLMLSGLATGASWLCYFRALQLGDVSKVVTIDKSSTVLTMLLAFAFLDEKITWLKGLCIVLIAAGTLLTALKSKRGGAAGSGDGQWLLYAVLSAVFASLTAILGKVGINGVESNLGTAIRTCVVLCMAWVMVFATGKQDGCRNIDRRELIFICLSGVATGASWLCYFRALKDGVASVVVPVDKLSILVTIAFSYIVFREKPNKRASFGLALIVAGTLLLLV